MSVFRAKGFLDSATCLKDLWNAWVEFFYGFSWIRIIGGTMQATPTGLVLTVTPGDSYRLPMSFEGSVSPDVNGAFKLTVNGGSVVMGTINTYVNETVFVVSSGTTYAYVTLDLVAASASINSGSSVPRSTLTSIVITLVMINLAADGSITQLQHQIGDVFHPGVITQVRV